MGKTDYVPAALAEAGVRPVFHKVRQKPGKPLWFGLAPGGRPVFALPGNPASVLVCLYRYVLPALRGAMGETPEPSRFARLEAGAPATGSLAHFRPVRAAAGPDGSLLAAFAENQGSGDFSGWARCDGFVELAAEAGPWAPGSGVPFHPW
jgi:molybdopterin molybdotransferase